ncbi:hypothetical protein FIBSPDRAFT_129150 [Athelia psychrophila]|uniref:Uncharacterized protein n=1 Tax=Athelia psychrophila TaxID=1759441 RepID=A0A166CHH1_9AGAM|nr:hypothetical protein FIBSPDRAFT_129150 [Fibularhizoctonia sp. CBS 109695]
MRVSNTAGRQLCSPTSPPRLHLLPFLICTSKVSERRCYTESDPVPELPQCALDIRNCRFGAHRASASSGKRKMRTLLSLICVAAGPYHGLFNVLYARIVTEAHSLRIYET